MQELEQELLKVQPEKGPVSQVFLSLATARLNSRIRRDGLSSRELWTQRDQFTGKQFPVDDDIIIKNQMEARESNHTPSAVSKLRSSSNKSPGTVSVGGLVYLVSERSKLQARDKYLVTSINRNMCTLRKFTRHQFRKKEYEVPLNSVYPIVRDSEASRPTTSDSESDYYDDGIVEASVDEPDRAEEGEEAEEVVGEPVAESSTRPRRATSTPPWHSDYVMYR